MVLQQRVREDGVCSISEEHRGMSDWQPIETAPKDIVWASGATQYGVNILAGSVYSSEPYVCKWWQHGEASNWIGPGGWPVNPTHWMPLPKPPAK
jgi:hypothetical protein